MSDQSFFEELQSDFLSEVSFLLETYEEHMLGLENDDDKTEHSTQIFRVAHSIKGGAAAVGFQDFSHFAHKVEDLLSILRAAPEFVSSEIISILLVSGDEFKRRVKMLQEKDQTVWDVTELEGKIKQTIDRLTGKESAQTDVETKPAPLDSNVEKTASEIIPLDEEKPEVDHTNYELLNELMSELPQDVIKDFNSQDSNEKDKPLDNVPSITEAKSAVEKQATPSQPNSQESAKKNIHKTHTNQIIKVDTTRVDSVLDAVGELVVLKNQIVHNEFIKNGNNPQLEAIVDQLDKGVRELYDKTLSIRMTPLKSLYIKIQRIVRDVSIALDKPVELELIGEETEVERTVFELLNDPLVHLVRNAMDHGIENKEKRKEKKKPETAKVTVSSKQMGGNVIIDIIDDGGGIDRDKILHKAIEKNIVPESVNPDNLTDEEVFKFIFSAGFSTAEKVSDLSGRGVGLDVVKSNIEKVNGKINIYSKPGKGSTFRLTIPLSTAITDGIVVLMNKQRFIMPIYAIKEIIRLKKDYFTEIPEKGFVAKVRDHLLPVVDLNPLFAELQGVMEHHSSEIESLDSNQKKRSDELMLVIVESGGFNSAIPVDDVLGQAQVVVKSLNMGNNVPEVSGAAILGDGKTVLILNPNEIVKDGQFEAAA
ncbi:MAG: chemotaxis protein CheA [Bdellovibrionales bacterium]|nr:chemotaxis protein CheA [Bdellovibrionales bacterium]